MMTIDPSNCYDPQFLLVLLLESKNCVMLLASFMVLDCCLFRTSDEDSGCAALLNWCWEQQKSSSFLSQRPLWPKVIAKQWPQNLEFSCVCFKYLSIHRSSRNYTSNDHDCVHTNQPLPITEQVKFKDCPNYCASFLYDIMMIIIRWLSNYNL